MKAKIASNFTGNLTSMLLIASSTPDPNSANNTSSDTITDVTPDPGLAGTGQNIVTWIVAGICVIVVATATVMHRRKRLTS
jgi:hypothetical protein